MERTAEQAASSLKYDVKQIKPRIVLDEHHQPAEVIIPYSDWLLIEQELDKTVAAPPFDINRLAGSLKLSEDPIEFQRRMRNEWQR